MLSVLSRLEFRLEELASTGDVVQELKVCSNGLQPNSKRNLKAMASIREAYRGLESKRSARTPRKSSANGSAPALAECVNDQVRIVEF